MMHFSNFANAAGQIKVDEWVKLAMEYKIPTMNDVAADTPPVSHLWDYANIGYDLMTFSGGKAIRGPQCAGMLIGKKDLVAYALNSPNEDTLGRCAKVGKEEIVGMVKTSGALSERRSRCFEQRMGGAARWHLKPDHESSRPKNRVLHA
jgi:seryl-tRNA(Sec) selenium transferase